MKKIKGFIRGKLIDYMLNDEEFIPIYSGDDLIDMVYRKIEE